MKKLFTCVAATLLLALPGFAQIVKSGYLTSSETWTKNNIYILSGFVYVTNGATITIEPGTVIKGEKSTKGALIITRGSKLIADGTSCEPIVFTSDQAPGDRTYGDWGGVILLGNGPINQAGGTAVIEGGVEDGQGNGTYGGGLTPNSADNSGILRYVRIEFPGIAFLPNNEINGLTMGGVGSGTIIENIMVSYSGDDAYEWFGGTVNCKNLIAYKSLDDDFDADNGYTGRVQFCVAFRDPNIADVSGSNGFEVDNDATGSSNTPKTNPLFSNVTIVGPGVSTSTYNANYKRGAHLRRNTEIDIANAILMGYPTGLLIDGTSTETNANTGLLNFTNSILSGMTTNLAVNSGSTFDITTWWNNEGGNNTYATNAEVMLTDALNYNFLPQVGSPAFSNFVDAATLDPYFATTSYRGAFGSTNWTSPWADWDPIFADYNAAINLAPVVTLQSLSSVICPNTGAVDISVSGGVSPYSYSWSNGATTQDISGLAAGSYTVSVTGANTCARSSTYTVNSLNIGKPAGLTTSDITQCSVTLSWNPVNGAQTYKVRYRVTGTSSWTNLGFIGNVVSYTYTGLASNTSYDLQVAAGCSNNTIGKWAKKVAVTGTGCAAPTNTVSTNITSSGATLTWTETCAVNNYSVQYRKVGNPFTTVSGITTNSYVLTGLIANSAHEWRVRTNCLSGSSPYTAIVTFNTLPLRLGEEMSEEVDPSFTLYPNPAQDVLNVSWNVTEQSGERTIEISNLMAQIVSRTAVGEVGSAQINISELPAGTYVVSLINGNHSSWQKLVISR